MFDGVGSRGCLSSGVGSSDAYLVVFGCFSGSVSSFCNIWSVCWVVLDNLVSAWWCSVKKMSGFFGKVFVYLVVLSQEVVCLVVFGQELICLV